MATEPESDLNYYDDQNTLAFEMARLVLSEEDKPIVILEGSGDNKTEPVTDSTIPSQQPSNNAPLSNNNNANPPIQSDQEEEDDDPDLHTTTAEWLYCSKFILPVLNRVAAVYGQAVLNIPPHVLIVADAIAKDKKKMEQLTIDLRENAKANVSKKMDGDGNKIAHGSETKHKEPIVLGRLDYLTELKSRATNEKEVLEDIILTKAIYYPLLELLDTLNVMNMKFEQSRKMLSNSKTPEEFAAFNYNLEEYNKKLCGMNYQELCNEFARARIEISNERIGNDEKSSLSKQTHPPNYKSQSLVNRISLKDVAIMLWAILDFQREHIRSLAKQQILAIRLTPKKNINPRDPPESHMSEELFLNLKSEDTVAISAIYEMYQTYLFVEHAQHVLMAGHSLTPEAILDMEYARIKDESNDCHSDVFGNHFNGKHVLKQLKDNESIIRFCFESIASAKMQKNLDNKKEGGDVNNTHDKEKNNNGKSNNNNNNNKGRRRGKKNGGR